MKIRKILYLNISNLHDNSKKYHLFYLEKTVFLSNFSCFLKILLQVGLSVYLAMYGWKVANIPLVNGIDPPKELFEVDPQRVFGLSISSSQLISHRMKRLVSINNTENTNYVDERMVAQEIRNANFIFEKGGFTILNVSNKPIETTANEVLNMMANRFQYRGRKLESPYPDVIKD